MKSRISILVCAAVLGAALVPAASQAAGAGRRSGDTQASRAGKAHPGAITKRVSQSRRSVLKYWTKRKMRKAEPRTITVLPGFGPGPAVRGTSEDPGDGAADGSAGTRVAPAAPEARASGSAGGAGGPSVSWSRTEITDTAAAPYRTHGKVFFTLGGSNYVCSGTSVSSGSESLVVTAGHCLYALGTGFASNFLFRPGFRDGDKPYGTWTAESLHTTSGWASTEDFRYDVGMAIVGTNDGVTLQDTVGARGILFGQSASQNYEAYGYPAASPFDGRKMWMCSSALDRRDGSGGVAPLGIGCDMTGGSSGGGWVVQSDYVNSVVSYGYSNLPDVLFGPYFGTTIETLYEEVSGGDAPTEPPPDPEIVKHAMGLKLRLRGHLKAVGRMFALDGYQPCVRYAPIEIYRVKWSGRKKLVGSTYTAADGTYSLRLPDRPGRYFAKGPPGPITDGINFCRAAKTPRVRHRA